MKALKIITISIIILIIGIFVILGYFNFINKKPKKIEIVFKSKEFSTINLNSEINLFLWNTGYCINDKDVSKNSFKQSNDKKVKENLLRICSLLRSNYLTDIYLIQSIDVASKRACNINQLKFISGQFQDAITSFGKHYDAKYIPFPINSPLGKIISGNVLISKYVPENSIRVSYPSLSNWPKTIFRKHQCLLINTYSVSNGKKLLVINSSNSHKHRKAEMNFLKKIITEEYQKGNYIIVGGSWEQLPADTTIHFEPFFSHPKIDANFLPSDWKWLYNKTIPTIRSNEKEYSPTQTKIAITDFYLISPNIEELEVTTLDLHFQNSNHQPIIAKVKLK